MRPVDRDEVTERLKGLDLHSDRSSHRSLEIPVVVVASQTLEVGADMDFDGLATECVSLDALRQRFGRLNRMGRRVKSRAVIVIRADQANPKRGEDDPIYGEALTRTWKWLDDGKDADGTVDFGIAAMNRRLEREGQVAELNAPAASAPVMLPVYVVCWAQTAPIPRPSLDVAPFLRGPRQGAPDVQVCWRADLDLVDDVGQAQTAKPADVRPGDVIVISTSHPGLWRRLGDLPLDATGTPDALDVGDPSHRIARAKPILRLHPALVSAWPDTLPAKQDALALLEDLGSYIPQIVTVAPALVSSRRNTLSRQDLDERSNMIRWPSFAAHRSM